MNEQLTAFFSLGACICLLASCTSGYELPAPKAKQQSVTEQPSRTAYEFSQQPTGPSLFDGCRRREPGPNQTLFSCTDLFIRLTTVPPGLSADQAFADFDSDSAFETRRVEVELNDDSFEGITFTGDGPGQVFERQDGIVIHVDGPKSKMFMECSIASSQDVEPSFDKCLDYLASLQKVDLSKLSGAGESRQVDFPGKPLVLPKGCVVEGPGEVRCGDDKLTWEVLDSQEAARSMRRDHEQKMTQFLPSRGARVVSERVFPCQVRGKAVGCRQFVSHFTFEDGQRYLAVFDTAVTVAGEHLFVLCSTWVEQPPSDTSIPAACSSLIERSEPE